MRLIPIYLILTLTACNVSDRVTSDAGGLHDGHMLRFDTGTDTKAATPDAGDNSTPPPDSGFDTIFDAIVQVDVIQTDTAPWIQTDVGTQCDGGIVDCGSSTMCGVCLAHCMENTQPPDYCFTLTEWQYVKHCYLTFGCAI